MKEVKVKVKVDIGEMVKDEHSRCPDCSKLLSLEHLRAITSAMVVLLSDVGEYLEFKSDHLLCEDCFEKRENEH